MDKFEVRVASVSGDPSTHVMHTEIVEASRPDVAVSKLLKKLGTSKTKSPNGGHYVAPLKLKKGHMATITVKAL